MIDETLLRADCLNILDMAFLSKIHINITKECKFILIKSTNYYKGLRCKIIQFNIFCHIWISIFLPNFRPTFFRCPTCSKPSFLWSLKVNSELFQIKENIWILKHKDNYLCMYNMSGIKISLVLIKSRKTTSIHKRNK